MIHRSMEEEILLRSITDRTGSPILLRRRNLGHSTKKKIFLVCLSRSNIVPLDRGECIVTFVNYYTKIVCFVRVSEMMMMMMMNRSVCRGGRGVATQWRSLTSFGREVCGGRTHRPTMFFVTKGERRWNDLLQRRTFSSSSFKHNNGFQKAAALGCGGVACFLAYNTLGAVEERREQLDGARCESLCEGNDLDSKYSIYEKCELKIFSGNAHPKLAADIAGLLGKPLNEATVSKFKNGESRVEILNSVRDCDVYVVQPTCNPCPNDYIMELVILLDAFRRAGAARVTAIIPIFGYARQDRKDKSRAPISAKVIADILHTAGVDRVLTIDLHAPQIQGFVNFPIDNLFGEPLIKQYLQESLKDVDSNNVVVVSPDAGGAKRADALAKQLKAGLAIMSKKRDKPGVVARMTLVGDVEDKTCIIVDDMVDTAGTLTRAAGELMKAGAKEVYASAVHGVLSDPAIDRINSSPIKEFIVTDTIPMKEKAERCPKMKVLSVAPLLAEAVQRIHTGGSLSILFRNAPSDKADGDWTLD